MLCTAICAACLVLASASETTTKVSGPAGTEGGLLSWPADSKLNARRLTLAVDADQKPIRGEFTVPQALHARAHVVLESSVLRPAPAILEGDGKRSYFLVGGSLVLVFVMVIAAGSALRRRWRKRRRSIPGGRRFADVP
ncbi:uncharacterized protein LOC142774296 [Rhipicephalus microplus]|uniref:uncharacterized protein LOC142774296 n=1 Tax=Rhipicephalus microplus TaxID=6941 RepID=UPI003F6AD155